MACARPDSDWPPVLPPPSSLLTPASCPLPPASSLLPPATLTALPSSKSPGCPLGHQCHYKTLWSPVATENRCSSYLCFYCQYTYSQVQMSYRKILLLLFASLKGICINVSNIYWTGFLVFFCPSSSFPLIHSHSVKGKSTLKFSLHRKSPLRLRLNTSSG